MEYVIRAGSYAYAEKYELPYPENSVLNAIGKYKMDNPKHNVPKITIDNSGSFSLDDHRTEDGLWHSAYFYDAPNNRIFHVVLRGNSSETSLYFNGVNEGLNLPNWKYINNDLPYAGNQLLLKDFEKKYLTRIKEVLAKR